MTMPADKELEKALDERDAQWQRGLSSLHLGYDGDGCESGDPIDWTFHAIKLHWNRIVDTTDAKIVSLTEDNARLRAALSDAIERLAEDRIHGPSERFMNRLRALLAPATKGATNAR